MYSGISKGEQKVARKLIEAALARGYTVTVNNGGDEDEITDSANFDDIWNEMGNTDQDMLMFTNQQMFAGKVLLVYGNDPDELINDYSIKLQSLMDEIEE